jgi:K+-sensing histidine kinase KdpD
MLDAILDTILKAVNIDACWIQRLDEDKNALSLVAQRGLSRQAEEEMRTIALDETLADKLIQPGQHAIETRFQDSIAFDAEMDQHKAHNVLIGIPIEARKVTGMLNVLMRTSRKPNHHEMQLLTSIGHQIGIAIENAQLAAEAANVEILKELNRLRSELIANVSHELRTPLGLIKLSCTSLLENQQVFDLQTKNLLLIGIDEETTRLEQIVNNLLDLSQIESGRLRLDKRPTDVAQLAMTVIKSIDIQAPQHHIVHNFVTPLVATIDGRRIEQVLRNLLSNAIKYSPAGGVIIVQGYEDKGRVLIQVTDQGIGIAPDDLDQIFERFYRVESPAMQRIGGVGLGLAVCKSIVEVHGGHIWVESDIGMGSTFYFTLPSDTSATMLLDNSSWIPQTASITPHPSF